MKPLHEHAATASHGVCCDLAAFGAVHLPLTAIPELRRHPEPLFGPGFPASMFKHLDEQTVAGLAAVIAAMRDGNLAQTGLCDWGVLAAPHFLGQVTLVTSLLRFDEEGAWGVSPHVIPHHSLHSVSGTVSQALKIHGPNLGIGGCTGAIEEALLTASAWIERRGLPGIWVVLTTLDPLSAIGPAGELPTETECVGLALALVPTRADHVGPRLRVHLGGLASSNDAPISVLQLESTIKQCRSARGMGGVVVGASLPRLELEWGRSLRHGALGRPHGDLRYGAVCLTSGAEIER